MKWAAVLAGGNGSRLQPLTRALMGDDRPKQFCPLLNGQTLLAQTRSRLAMNVMASRTMYVLTRAHEVHYRRELADVPNAQLIEQPRNCGTAAAIGYTMARVARVDKNAVLGFFPADHHYEDVGTFSRTVDTAYLAAEQYPGVVFLLGTQPTAPEVEYGWIEPGRSIATASPDVFAVSRFWEKPARAVAEELQTRGCLWNTFVMIGSVRAFRTLLDRAAPDLAGAFDLVEQVPSRETEIVDSIYNALIPVDFSQDVLAWHANRVGVVRVPHVGWTDLGHPARVRAFLTSHGSSAPALGVAS
jgi:mannose-1-phosphate guanylyltransferase